jgi:hypothetical protein
MTARVELFVKGTAVDDCSSAIFTKGKVMDEQSGTPFGKGERHG